MLPSVAKPLSDEELAKWGAEIDDAIGVRIGDPKSRAQFAQSILADVGIIVTYGDWGERFAQQARSDLVAITLQRAALRAPRETFDTESTEIREHMDAISKLLDDAEADLELELKDAPKRRPGPQNQRAVAVTATIAAAYHRHFGRLPGLGRDGSGRKTPYERVCDVIERFFEVYGVTQRLKQRESPLELHDPSRRAGIDRARRHQRPALTITRTERPTVHDVVHRYAQVLDDGGSGVEYSTNQPEDVA